MRLIVVMALCLILCCPVAQAQTLEQVKKQHIEKTLKTAEGQQIKKAVKKYSEMYKIDEKLVLAVIMTESNFNKGAVSPCGATGLMQLIPSTFAARNVGNNIWDIDQNIHAGTKHLAGLRDRHKGNVYLALSSYNLGGARVPVQGPTPEAAKGYVNRVFYHLSIIETAKI